MKKGYFPFLAAAISCLAVPASTQGAAGANEVRLKSDQKYMQGQYVTMPSVWSRYLDPTLRDYDNTIQLRKASFPNNTFMSWRFPDRYPVSGGVYGYNYVSYGQYWDAQPPQPIPSRRLKDIRNLTIGVKVVSAPRNAEYNILQEFFVTRAPNDIGSRVAEIGWILSAQQRMRDYLQSGRPVGTFEDRFGQKWVCTSHKDGAAGLYVTFVPAEGTTRLQTQIDALASLKWLIARNVVSGDTYFNGTAIGIEPVRGGGSAIIDRFNVAYQ